MVVELRVEDEIIESLLTQTTAAKVSPNWIEPKEAGRRRMSVRG